MINSFTELQQYLQDRTTLLKKLRSSQGCKYIGIEELILTYGKAMSAQPMPATIRRGLPKSCYYNSQKVAFKHSDLIYVEGYAIAQDISIPFAHAWLMTLEGFAIDVTWDEPGVAYFGIPFNTDWIKSILAARKARGREDNLSMLEGNYIEEFSLLTVGLPNEAYCKL